MNRAVFRDRRTGAGNRNETIDRADRSDTKKQSEAVASVMEAHVDFEYLQAEVVSAQRARFLHNPRLRLIVVGALAALALVAVLLGPSNWYYALFAGLIIATLLVRTYWLAPIEDFRRNPVWRATYTLHLGPDQFRLTLKGKSQGQTVRWRQITQAFETRNAFLLFWGRESAFIVIPTRVAGEAGFEETLRQRLPPRPPGP